MPTDHALRTLALYGAARAFERVGTPQSACAAVERFTQFIGRPDADSEKRERASTSLPALITRCGQPAPVAPPPLTPAPADSTWAWATTATAGATLLTGGVLLVLARGAVADGDADYARFVDGGRVDAQVARQVTEHDDRARAYGYGGYAALGVGALLGAVAAWLWLDPPIVSPPVADEPGL